MDVVYDHTKWHWIWVAGNSFRKRALMRKSEAGHQETDTNVENARTSIGLVGRLPSQTNDLSGCDQSC